jgi:hypothetical protein
LERGLVGVSNVVHENHTGAFCAEEQAQPLWLVVVFGVVLVIGSVTVLGAAVRTVVGPVVGGGNRQIKTYKALYKEWTGAEAYICW